MANYKIEPDELGTVSLFERVSVGHGEHSYHLIANKVTEKTARIMIENLERPVIEVDT